MERCHELLKEGKYLGIVIDDGVLNNPSNYYVREQLYRYFIIEAVVSLPFEIFKERGATNRTSVLLLKKKSDTSIQGDIFMAIAESAGELFGKLGHRLENKLNDIYLDWLEYKKGNRKFKIAFVIKKSQLENYYDTTEGMYRNRIDPKYYNPEFRKLKEKIDSNPNSDIVENVITFEKVICPPDEVNAFGSKYIKKITKNGQIDIGIMDGVNDPKGKEDVMFKTGDLVASRINIKSGMIAFIPDTIDEIRATSEYYKLVPKLDDKHKPKILLKYLYIILTSGAIQFIMDSVATGQYMRLKEDELSKVKIPVPSLTEQGHIIKEWERERDRAISLRVESQNKISELRNSIDGLLLNGKLS